MRKWQAIPVAAVAAFLAGAALFTSAAPVVRAVGPVQTLALVCQVQADCKFSGGTTAIDVDIVLTNNDTSSISVANFNFEVYNSNKAFLTPSTPTIAIPHSPTDHFNCSLKAPVADSGAYGGSATGSSVSCINADSPTGDVVVLASQAVTLGTVHFAANGPDSAELLLTNVTVAGVSDILACDPDEAPPAVPAGAGLAPCSGATAVVGQGGFTSTPAVPTDTPTATATPTATRTKVPTTPTSLAYVTITPNAQTQTATAPTAVPATPVPGGPPPPAAGGGKPAGNTGGAGAGGSRPINLPNAGTGARGGIDWTSAALMALLAVAIGGVAGALYFGVAQAAESRRGRSG
jgi:hypothetical protein